MEAAPGRGAHVAAGHPVGQARAVELDAHAGPVGGQPGHGGLQAERHPARFHALADHPGHVGVDAGQDLRVARQHRDAGAEIRVGPRQLGRHRAAADEGQRGGKGRQEQQLVGGDHQLVPRHRGDHRLGAGRDHEALGPERHAVHLDDVRIAEARGADRDPDALPLELGRVRPLALHHLAQPPLHRLPVEPHPGGPGAEAGALAGQAMDASGRDQRLLGDAASVHAEAAERAPVGEGHPRSQVGRGPGRGDAGGAGPDRHEVEAFHPAPPFRP